MSSTIRKTQRKLARPKARINEGIKASEVRLIGADNENLGTMPIKKAIEKAREMGLDLVEVTASAKPPVARITDHGKFQYEQNKLRKQWTQSDKEKGKVQELKNVQIKPGTSGDILSHRSVKVRGWLVDGHKVRIKLYLSGRYKSMDQAFLKNILDDFLKTVDCEYEVIEQLRKAADGYIVVLQPKK